jgi:hypothetical protein
MAGDGILSGAPTMMKLRRMAEGNIVRNTSENQTHVIADVSGDYVLLNDGWWITTDDVVL